MSLTVLSVAYPFAPVGRHCVGGAEQILTDLDCALVTAGYTSLVLACEGSAPAGRLLPLPPFHYFAGPEDRRRWQAEHGQAAIDRAVSTHHPDLIHIHSMDFNEYRLPPDIPVLVTLHLPLSWYPAGFWKELPANMTLQYVSETQRLSGPPELHNLPVVPNGVDLAASLERKRHFAMTLGRICPEKNQHVALEAGFAANIPVILAGAVFPYREHREYFEQKVQPLLRETSRGILHKFCGPLDPVKKQQLLAQARCLLHPTLAPETSSLVAMEALAAGTPVIAYPSGALPEIVDHGVTGFLVSSAEEMAEAVNWVDGIESQACRAAARRRFSKERMIAGYFHLYSELLQASVEQLTPRLRRQCPLHTTR